MASSVESTKEQVALNDKLCPFKPSRGPKAVFPAFDPSWRRFSDEGMSIEANHGIPMRDGVRLRADIYLPTPENPVSKLPVVLAITPYGKQNPFDVSQVLPNKDFDAGFDGVVSSKYAPFEGSDPLHWTRHGFAYVITDARGSFASEGDKANFVSKLDGLDAYDVIEYLGTRPWSNGHVGMIGASALGAIQWQAAALRPPHLSGILVQDGFTDLYREIAFKGGVLHSNFVEILDDVYRSHGNREGTPVLDLTKACELHPYFDEFWKLYTADIENISCPIYVVSSLADNGIHTPGTIRGYLAAGSKTKYLELHPYRKWEWQLTPESLERQTAFLNQVLHGPDRYAAQSVNFWPKVRLHVTEKHYAGSWRSEPAYPLIKTMRTKYFFGKDSCLFTEISASQAVPDHIQYDARTGSTSWKVTFTQPTEITGSSKLHLRFSVSEGLNDADIFVTLQKFDRQGNIVYFPYHSFINDGHVAYGWLRASKRALHLRPWGDEVAQTYLEEDVSLLRPNEPVDLDINIQPTATLFRKGETLKVVVQGHDFGEYGPMCEVPRAGAGCNGKGCHTIYLTQSYLEIPVISRKP